jgi:LPXTG-motif cell wall-anchored protein
MAKENLDQLKNESEFERFVKLSSDNQKKILAEVFEKRVNFAKNLFYRNEVRIEGYENNNGKSGAPVGKVARRNYTLWQLNNDYRYNIDFFDPSQKNALQWATAWWDSKEGIQKTTLKNESLDRTFARIDTVLERSLLLNDHYSFWLQSGSSETYQTPHYLFPYLLEHQNEWNIVAPFEEDKIQLTLGYDPGIRGTTAIQQEGKLSIVLDPSKDYMPIRGSMRGDMVFEKDRKHWREEIFTVKESKLINGIWMPYKLETRISSANSPINKISIIFSTITEMEQGKVTKEDVTMKFPESTEVTDAINGISYKTDVNGNPIESTIQPLYGLDPSKVKLPEKKHSKTANYVLIVIGLLLIVLALYLMFKKNKKAS